MMKPCGSKAERKRAKSDPSARTVVKGWTSCRGCFDGVFSSSSSFASYTLFFFFKLAETSFGKQCCQLLDRSMWKTLSYSRKMRQICDLLWYKAHVKK